MKRPIYEWSRRLKNAGVHVILSIPGLKIHSKLFLISRLEEGKLVRYAHIGTGNFNESTAKLYTDYALLTKDHRIEVSVELLDNDVRQQVIAVLELLFSDTVKARVVDQAISNRYVTRGRRRKTRGQLAVYHYLAEWPQAARAPSVLPVIPATSSVIVPPDADNSPSAARRRRGQGG